MLNPLGCGNTEGFSRKTPGPDFSGGGNEEAVCAFDVLTVKTASGVIGGVVKDYSGALVVGAKVKLTDESTNQTREQLTNPEGIFEFRALPPG